MITARVRVLFLTRLCLKSRNRAPKARNMKARGKREAKRSASPLVAISSRI